MFLPWLHKKTDIGDLVPGSTRTIRGVVQCDRCLKIPPTGMGCVFYSLMEERFKKGARGQGRPLWFPETFEVRCAEFTIADDTGCIQVTASGEQVKPKGLHQDSGLVKGNKKRRFFVAYLRPGDVVIARGQITGTPTDKTLLLGAPPSPLKIAVVGQGEIPATRGVPTVASTVEH